MVLSAMLIAVGILIPVIAPIKILIEPMSFTLASHVAIMVAMFVSPSVAVAVALGTTLGFVFIAFPLPVVLRALSHVVWAYAGAYYLKKHNDALNSFAHTALFVLAIGLLHAVCEVIIVLPIYVGTTSVNDFLYMVFGLVGIGTVVTVRLISLSVLWFGRLFAIVEKFQAFLMLRKSSLLFIRNKRRKTFFS